MRRSFDCLATRRQHSALHGHMCSSALLRAVGWQRGGVVSSSSVPVLSAVVPPCPLPSTPLCRRSVARLHTRTLVGWSGRRGSSIEHGRPCGLPALTNVVPAAASFIAVHLPSATFSSASASSASASASASAAAALTDPKPPLRLRIRRRIADSKRRWTNCQHSTH